MHKIFSVAIDGPAGAGKSTVARAAAEALGAVYLDTGAMYRTMGLYMKQMNFSDAEDIAHAANDPCIEIRFPDGTQHMYLNGLDVSAKIRTPEASMMAARVSTVPEVRRRLVELQREFARGNSVIMDGRDIGTDVLPNATVKIFLTASPAVRAQRRCDELKRRGTDVSYDQVLAEIEERDYIDSHRAASPMRQAEGAVRLDTSDMTPEQAVAAIVERVQRTMQE